MEIRDSPEMSRETSPGMWLYGKLAYKKATIEIPDELYREAKIAAATQGVKIKDMVAEGLRMVLHAENAPVQRKRIKFPLIACGAPGTLQIPDDAAAQLDALEDLERHALSV